MFRDEVEIEVIAGRGGDGLVSFRHEAHVPLGGPDGGDGGRGGDVVFVAADDVNSLLHVGRMRKVRAKGGAPGGARNKTGRGGADTVLHVPVGTQVLDAEHGNLLYDFAEKGLRLVIAEGGERGKGNARFATSVNQVPRKATLGKPGESRRIRLELKLLAEVGLVGLPNAGKSTFLSRVTAATPKIADYPFTTLVPQVAIAAVGDYDTLCLADLPGLIEGAAEGAGLGDRFLRHVERCPCLLHLVDVSSDATTPPEEALRVIEGELEKTSFELSAKPRVLAASKVEDEESERRAADLERAAGRKVHRLSSVTGRGVTELLAELQRIVRGPVES